MPTGTPIGARMGGLPIAVDKNRTKRGMGGKTSKGRGKRRMRRGRR